MDFFVLRGGVPEWLKGTGCKPVGVRLRWFESNPLHQVFRPVGGVSKYWRAMFIKIGAGEVLGGRSSMVEPQPSKLDTWVRFPPPAPAFNKRDRVGAGAL